MELARPTSGQLLPAATETSCVPLGASTGREVGWEGTFSHQIYPELSALWQLCLTFAPFHYGVKKANGVGVTVRLQAEGGSRQGFLPLLRSWWVKWSTDTSREKVRDRRHLTVNCSDPFFTDWETEAQIWKGAHAGPESALEPRLCGCSALCSFRHHLLSLANSANPASPQWTKEPKGHESPN